MRVLTENIYLRGAKRIAYVRRRIPTAIRAAYPTNVTHIARSLGTSDVKQAKVLGRKELSLIDEEFGQKREQLDLGQASVSSKRVATLSLKQLDDTAQFFMRSVLQSDEHKRQDGVTDDDFDELSERLNSQRNELGRTLTQGKAMKLLPALRGLLHLCGLDYAPDEEEAKRASYAFLRGVISTLDHQISRQNGNIVDTDSVAPRGLHPLQAIAPERAPTQPGLVSWENVFNAWNVFTDNRPKSTTIAPQTPWRDLRRFAELSHVLYPAQVTPELMTKFAQDMKGRGLAVDTINERLSKIKAVYKIAVGRHLLPANPAKDTLGFKENTAQQRQKRRLPFDLTDLNVLFGSDIYTRHARSQGQSGEASYWIPLLMYYTGARPEEIAGLALSDLVNDAEHGWYLRIVDRPTTEDFELFSEVPKSHSRTLENEASVRRVPVARELIELGLLRYVSWLQANGSTVLFPTLVKDWHGKLSGSFSKFFGRYKRAIGVNDNRKVLYSFRHSMKDFLEAAQVPSKYLQRILGHTTGDGVITDRYGSDLPSRLAEHAAESDFYSLLSNDVHRTDADRKRCYQIAKQKGHAFMDELHNFEKCAAQFERAPATGKDRTDNDIVRELERLLQQIHVLEMQANSAIAAGGKLTTKERKLKEAKQYVDAERLASVKSQLEAAKKIALSRGMVVSLNRSRTVIKRVDTPVAKPSAPTAKAEKAPALKLVATKPAPKAKTKTALAKKSA